MDVSPIFNLYQEKEASGHVAGFLNTPQLCLENNQSPVIINWMIFGHIHLLVWHEYTLSLG